MTLPISALVRSKVEQNPQQLDKGAKLALIGDIFIAIVLLGGAALVIAHLHGVLPGPLNQLGLLNSIGPKVAYGMAAGAVALLALDVGLAIKLKRSGKGTGGASSVSSMPPPPSSRTGSERGASSAVGDALPLPPPAVDDSDSGHEDPALTAAATTLPPALTAPAAPAPGGGGGPPPPPGPPPPVVLPVDPLAAVRTAQAKKAAAGGADASAGAGAPVGDVADAMKMALTPEGGAARAARAKIAGLRRTVQNAQRDADRTAEAATTARAEADRATMAVIKRQKAAEAEAAEAEAKDAAQDLKAAQTALAEHQDG